MEDKKTMEEHITWLHIADMHMNSAGVETRRMRKGLLKYLEENNVRCDYVFFTGDLRNAPDKEFTEDSIEYLKAVCGCVGTPLQNLYMVPGNHDIERDLPERIEAIERIFQGNNSNHKGYYKSNQGQIENTDLTAILTGKCGFIQLIEKLYESIPDRIGLYKNNIPHSLIKTGDFNIILLDSTLVYTDKQEDCLIIGTEILLDLFERLDKNKITIILTHYSFDFLLRDEQCQICRIIRETDAKCLWLAGHEHTNMARKQQDVFFEFQCGNLRIEEESKSCIMLGEIFPSQICGNIKGFAWIPPDGWALYPYINLSGPNKAVYNFDFKETYAIKRVVKENILSAAKEVSRQSSEIKLRELGNGIKIFNLRDLNLEVLKSISDADFETIRQQLGNRLSGSESKERILELFLAEVEMTLNSQKRYECMPIFQHVVRDTYKCNILIEDQIAPVDQAVAVHYFWDDFDVFEINGNRYMIGIMNQNKKTVAIKCEYFFSDLTDAEERLYGLGKIHNIIAASKVNFHMVGNSKCNLSVSLDGMLEHDKWEKQIEITEHWIDQMKRIIEIEQYFDIKFTLPQKASEDDYNAIYILSDSINRRCCITLPAIPMEKPEDEENIVFEKEYHLGDATNLPQIILFGFIFKPVYQYVIPCTLRWKKKKWETREGGFPTGVEFELVV